MILFLLAFKIFPDESTLFPGVEYFTNLDNVCYYCVLLDTHIQYTTFLIIFFLFLFQRNRLTFLPIYSKNYYSTSIKMCSFHIWSSIHHVGWKQIRWRFGEVHFGDVWRRKKLGGKVWQQCRGCRFVPLVGLQVNKSIKM